MSPVAVFLGEIQTELVWATIFLVSSVKIVFSVKYKRNGVDLSAMTALHVNTEDLVQPPSSF